MPIEPESAARPAETDCSQLLGVFIDPVALDSEFPRQGGGVGEFHGPGLLGLLQELDYSTRNRLNGLRVDVQLGAVALRSTRWWAVSLAHRAFACRLAARSAQQRGPTLSS